MTLAIPVRARIRSYAIRGHEEAGCFCGLPHCEAEPSHTTTAVARTDAIAWEAESTLVEIKPHWRPTEDEIVRAAITVILVALGVIIALAAGAILTMG
jgi:hypothetical protein